MGSVLIERLNSEKTKRFVEVSVDEVKISNMMKEDTKRSFWMKEKKEELLYGMCHGQVVALGNMLFILEFEVYWVQRVMWCWANTCTYIW